ncbi:MAG: ferrochelatase [Acidobacteriota bacterium]|jgi:protoporphyrin/coproporphyrin ferrochelatase
MSQPYDALVLVSFGGPESRDEVIPFLENVLRGRNVPRGRLLEVAEHYYEFGGVSPINRCNRELIAAVETELEKRGPRLPIYWGNRNWHPFINDTVRRMAEDGVRRALAFVTSAYSSYSSCRQYREDIQKARSFVGPRAPRIDKIRVFYNHPGFIEANVDHVRQAYEEIDEAERSSAPLVFSGHSIPLSMAKTCLYQEQLEEVGRLVAAGAGVKQWHLAYQSRSGPPHQPWLEPDVGDLLEQLQGRGHTSVVVSPIGFISDHMEVIYDLDTELRKRCDAIGLAMARAATPGTHPEFVAMIRELILERMNQSPIRRYLGDHGASRDFCPVDCCPAV